MPRLAFTKAEREAIAGAIAKAEAKTSGEVVVVVAEASDGYRSFGLLWAALIALATPLPLIYWTDWSLQRVYLAELIVFFVLALLTQIEPVRLALVPGGIKRAAAHRRAVEQFLVQNLHTTEGRTGILIYVSFAERFAEIIADEAVYKKTPQPRWDEIVIDLTGHLSRGARLQGLLGTIEACGELLARHFPPGAPNRNELPNHLIVLDDESFFG